MDDIIITHIHTDTYTQIILYYYTLNPINLNNYLTLSKKKIVFNDCETLKLKILITQILNCFKNTQVKNCIHNVICK